MLEDADDKIRRNLVTASAIILLLAWLDLPIPIVADRLLGVNAAAQGFKFSAARVWWAALAVLCYFALRFRFAGDTIATYREMLEERRRIGLNMLASLLRRHLARYTRKGLDSVLFLNALDMMASKQTKEMSQDATANEATLGRPAIEFNGLELKIDFEGQVGVTYVWQHPQRGRMSSEGGQLAFAVTGWARMRLTVAATLRAIVYSQGSMNLVWPVALATGAFGAVIWQLIQSYVSSR